MKIKFKFDKKTIAVALVCAWGVFAVWYVANDQWQDFKMNEREQAYKMGVQDGENKVIRDIIDETSKCQQQIPVSLGEATVNIVSVECLQKIQAQQQVQPPVQTPTPQAQPSVEQ